MQTPADLILIAIHAILQREHIIKGNTPLGKLPEAISQLTKQYDNARRQLFTISTN
jgi:hypothetical protein